MKNIKIGRGNDCQIFLDDAMVSRNHALLKVGTFGKLEIVDMSANGTFVNGLKVPQGRPFPVSRKDVVSFAGTETLNWDLVPNPLKYVKWVAAALAALIALIAIILVVKSFTTEPEYYEEDSAPSSTVSDNAKDTDTKADAQDEGGKNFFKKKQKKTSDKAKKTEKSADKKDSKSADKKDAKGEEAKSADAKESGKASDAKSGKKEEKAVESKPAEQDKDSKNTRKKPAIL